MKKLLNAPVLIGTIALLVLLVVGSVGAGPALEVEPEIEPGGPGEHEPEPGGGGESEDGSESEIIGPDTEGASLRGSGSDPENPSARPFV